VAGLWAILEAWTKGRAPNLQPSITTVPTIPAAWAGFMAAVKEPHRAFESGGYELSRAAIHVPELVDVSLDAGRKRVFASDAPRMVEQRLIGSDVRGLDLLEVGRDIFRHGIGLHHSIGPCFPKWLRTVAVTAAGGMSSDTMVKLWPGSAMRTVGSCPRSRRSVPTSPRRRLQTSGGLDCREDSRPPIVCFSVSSAIATRGGV
jgi:hypothetical protein